MMRSIFGLFSAGIELVTFISIPGLGLGVVFKLANVGVLMRYCELGPRTGLLMVRERLRRIYDLLLA